MMAALSTQHLVVIQHQRRNASQRIGRAYLGSVSEAGDGLLPVGHPVWRKRDRDAARVGRTIDADEQHSVETVIPCSLANPAKTIDELGNPVDVSQTERTGIGHALAPLLLAKRRDSDSLHPVRRHARRARPYCATNSSRSVLMRRR